MRDTERKNEKEREREKERQRQREKEKWKREIICEEREKKNTTKITEKNKEKGK